MDLPPSYAYEPLGSTLARTLAEISRITEGYLRLPSIRGDQAARIWAIEQEAAKDARDLVKAVPASRELNTLLGKLEEIVLLACAGIVINEPWPESTKGG